MHDLGIAHFVSALFPQPLIHSDYFIRTGLAPGELHVLGSRVLPTGRKPDEENPLPHRLRILSPDD